MAPSSEEVFLDNDLPLEYLTICETTSENINPIANFIDSVGNFEYKDEHYTVREPRLVVVDELTFLHRAT